VLVSVTVVHLAEYWADHSELHWAVSKACCSAATMAEGWVASRVAESVVLKAGSKAGSKVAQTDVHWAA